MSRTQKRTGSATITLNDIGVEFTEDEIGFLEWLLDRPDDDTPITENTIGAFGLRYVRRAVEDVAGDGRALTEAGLEEAESILDKLPEIE